jgi:hypothetical protein
MLADPSSFAHYPFREDHLVVQHMDGRRLLYPDNTFDGIYSSGSIEHFGSLEYIANAAYEMGRVLKPGGILTLATEYKVNGPPGGDYWDPSTFILSRERIQEYIVEASGLELVDELDTDISVQTMLAKRDLLSFLQGAENKKTWAGKITNFPNLVLVHEGYVFCSIHLTLRKTENYPAASNTWAKPSDDTEKMTMERRQHLMENISANQHISTPPKLTPSIPPFAPTIQPVIDYQHIHNLSQKLAEWNRLRVYHDDVSRRNIILRIIKPLGFLYRVFMRIRLLGKVWGAQAELYEMMLQNFDLLNHNALLLTDRLPHLAYTEEINKYIAARIEEISDSFGEVEERRRTLEQSIFQVSQRVENLRGSNADIFSDFEQRLDNLPFSDLQAHIEQFQQQLDTIDLQTSLDQLQQRLQSDYQNRIEQLQQQLQQFGSSDFQVRLELMQQKLYEEHQPRIEQMHQQIEEMNNLYGQLEALQTRIGEVTEVAQSLDEQITTIDTKYASSINMVDARVRLIISRSRYLQEQVNGLSKKGKTAPSRPLISSDQLIEIIDQLEERQAYLHDQTVEVIVDDHSLEGVVFDLVEHFSGRIDPYQPQVIYYLNLSEDGFQEAILKYRTERLSEDGACVVIASGNITPSLPDLKVIYNQTKVIDGQDITILIMKRLTELDFVHKQA